MMLLNALKTGTLKVEGEDKKKRLTPEDKKRVEFAKKIMVGMFLNGSFMIIAYYLLVAYSIWVSAKIGYAAPVPDAALPVAGVTEIFGGFMFYCLYQFGCKNSRNKYGVDANGNPFVQALEGAADVLVTTPNPSVEQNNDTDDDTTDAVG